MDLTNKNIPLGLGARLKEIVKNPICPVNIELFTYWASVCEEKKAPTLKQLDPLKFKHLLPHIFMFDVINGGDDFKVRYFGEAATNITGKDYTGKNLSQNLQEHTEWRFGLCQMIVNDKNPITYHSVRGDDDDLFISETTVLPIVNDKGNVVILLNIFDQVKA